MLSVFAAGANALSYQNCDSAGRFPRSRLRTSSLALPDTVHETRRQGQGLPDREISG